MRNIWRPVAWAALALFTLASCYVPDRFEAEIRLSKDGSFGITYIGILTYAPLYGQIMRGDISPEKADENNTLFMEQLKRDPDFKEVSPLGRGRYQVRYQREGRLAGNLQMVNFPTRQQAIFRVRTTESGLIQVNGSGQGQLYAARFEEIGLRSQGLVRIVTDAEVLETNAGFTRASPAPGYTQYDWRIRSFSDPPPKFIARLAVDPRTGVPAYSGGGSN